MPTDYKITVKTGNVLNAGTDANVYIAIYGDQGSTYQQKLDGPGNDFEQGETNTFRFDDNDIGTLTKIYIHQDGSGLAPAWYLDFVIVETGDQDVTFSCYGWLDSDSGLSRWLTPDKN